MGVCMVCMSVSCSVVSNTGTPWTTACQAPLSVGFSRQEYWSGQPFPSPGDLPNPEIKPGSPSLQTDSLLSELLGKPHWGHGHSFCGGIVVIYRQGLSGGSSQLLTMGYFCQFFINSMVAWSALLSAWLLDFWNLFSVPAPQVAHMVSIISTESLPNLKNIHLYPAMGGRTVQSQRSQLCVQLPGGAIPATASHLQNNH